MKSQYDDGNYEGLIARLTKGSLQQKSSSLKKLNFLYDNARSRIYLYERRITECLELLLLIQQKQISFQALTLLEKIISNSSTESENFSIIKKRLLANIVLNLGSIQINVRKISHKCLIEFVRKFRECDTILPAYIKTAMQQTQNFHLKLKSINSLHSLIMTQPKSFVHGSINTQILIEQLIYSSYQKQHSQVKKAATLCLIYCMRLDGSEKTLKLICSNAQNDLYQLTFENEEIASILELIMKFKTKINQKEQSEVQSAPSPKFMTLNEEEIKKELNEEQIEKVQRISDQQMKIYNEINYAEQFLKRLEKTQLWQIRQIKEFVPYLQKYLIDESIKLFSISKKIVQVIFQNQCQKQREYYVILVPCVVNGIGNKRFIVRKNLNKLVRQYLKKHTQVWVQNFIEKMSRTTNPKVKEILIQLFMHAYRTSPEFYHPPEKTFNVMEREVRDLNSNLKWKAIDCLIMVIQRQGKTEKMREDMMSTLSPEVYNKLLRKMNKTHNSIGSHSGSINEPLSPVQKIQRKERRFIRMVTDDPINSLEKQTDLRKDNISEEKVKPLLRQKKVRKSYAEIDFKLKKPERKQREERDSLKKLPQLRKIKNSNVSKIQVNESPVKRSLGEKSIMYVDKQNLPEMLDPKSQLNKALLYIRDHSWNTQFQSINSIRSVIEYHREVITEELFTNIINQLLNCLNNMRSGVSKISLICLGQLLKRFHKKSYPFTQSIVNTLIKKSVTTSDFIQEEIKRCITISVEELCPNRIISSLTTLKQNKSSEVKVSVILMLEIMIQNQKIYKRQTQWIWSMIVDFYDDQNQIVRNQAKKITKLILQKYSDWKNQVLMFKSMTLQKIDRILRSLSSSSSANSWIQAQNKELNKIIVSRTMTTKYFEKEYSKFQELDKGFVLKKNWKQRIRLVNQVFNNAFEHAAEFQLNIHAKKYIHIACDHLDEKNPGLFLNVLTIFNKSLDTFSTLLEDCLPYILQKTLAIIQIKKTEIGQTTQKFLTKLYNKVDGTKLSKQLFKISVGNSQKIRNQALGQLISIWKSSKSLGNSIQNITLKVLQKLSVDPLFDDKLKQIINLGVRKFGHEFEQKIQENEKLSIFLE